ncbi:homeobox protein goosecoid-2, partial [Daubentonia madagascariensis]
MAAAGGAASRGGPGRPCPFSIEHILSSLPERSPPARAARPPQPAGRQSPAQPGEPGAPEAAPCACCCCCGPRGPPEAAAGLGARLPWPLRLGPAAPLSSAAPAGGSGGAARRGRPGPAAAHAAPPHDLQRGAAAGARGALRAEPVPRRGRARAPGRPHPPARGARGGLVQEPPGQVAPPEARSSVREAPAWSQEAPQGDLL